MKNHFSNQLIERPRHRSDEGFHSIRPRLKGKDEEYLDSLPRRQSIRRPYKETGDWKTLSDNLNPLKRFLDSKVGQFWAKVRSEIYTLNDYRNTSQRHLLEHLNDYVYEEVVRFDKNKRAYVDAKSHWGGYYYPDFYVNYYGILCKNNPAPEFRSKVNNNIKKINNLLYLTNRDGTWFELHLVPAKEYKDPRGYVYTFLYNTQTNKFGDFKAPHGYLIQNIRTLSKKDKKKYKL